MNYYVQSIEKYIINEWIRSFSSIEAPREVKFIVQSLSPKSVFELFNALEKRKQELLKTNNIACQFRVATGLWREWCLSNDEKELDQKMDEYGAIRNGTPPERMWIDEEDRLTWYRNRTAHDENAKELVVVLVGFNHATDKGGLSDFHRVDEERIWDFLEKSFDPWISSLNSTLKLHLDSEESERINIYLQEIYSLRPLSLSKISDFLNHIEATYKSFDNFSDFEESFFKSLPYWQIPVLLIPKDKKNQKDLKSYLREAESFISHKSYMEAHSRKNTKDKIFNEILNERIDLPSTFNGVEPYQDLDDYQNTLFSFIDKADLGSRERLLNTDIYPLIKILKSKKLQQENLRLFKD